MLRIVLFLIALYILGCISAMLYGFYLSDWNVVHADVIVSLSLYWPVGVFYGIVGFLSDIAL